MHVRQRMGPVALARFPTPCAAVLAAYGFCAGCSTVSAPTRPLASYPVQTVDRFYVSTRFPDAPYETVGFLQVERHGVTAAGVADLGDVQLNEALSHFLGEATAYGANGAVIVAFEDVDPPHDAERYDDLASSIQTGEVEQRERTVRFSAELIRILDGVDAPTAPTAGQQGGTEAATPADSNGQKDASESGDW